MKYVKGLIPFAFLLLVACGNTEDEYSAMTQSMGDGLYQNQEFGLSVQKPGGWYSQDIEEMMMAMQMGGHLLSGEDQNLRAVIDSAMKTSLPLFGFYEFAPGTPGKMNANVLAVAENVALYPGVKTGCDYLENAKALMQQSAMQAEFGEVCETRTVNGLNLNYHDVTIRYGAQAVHQRYFACRKGDHAISVIQTYFDEESEQKVDAVLHSMELGCEA